MAQVVCGHQLSAFGLPTARGGIFPSMMAGSSFKMFIAPQNLDALRICCRVGQPSRTRCGLWTLIAKGAELLSLRPVTASGKHLQGLAMHIPDTIFAVLSLLVVQG